MAPLHGSWIVIYAAAVTLILQGVSAQIPAACANTVSLGTLTCCPNNCGAADERGMCADIDLPNHYSLTTNNTRANWPHYFTRACSPHHWPGGG